MRFDTVNKVWSNSPRDEIICEGLCLGEWILQKLGALDPNKVVEIYYDTGEQCTVEELTKLTVSCARGLSALGVKKGDIVVLFSQLNEQVSPVAFGCFLIGAAIHTVETNFNDEDSDSILLDVNPTVIVYEPCFEDRVNSTVGRLSLSKLKHIISFGSGRNSVEQVLFNHTEASELYLAPKLGNPDTIRATALLTSGSTCRPKIVQLSQTQYVFGAYNCVDLGLCPENIICVTSPLRWNNQVSSLLLPLVFGCTRIVSGLEPSAANFTKIIKETKTDVFVCVASLLYSSLRYAQENDSTCMDSVRLLVTGGEVVMEDMLLKAQELLPQSKVILCYGCSEMAGLVAADRSFLGKKGGELQRGMSLQIIGENSVALGPNELGQIHLRVEFPLMGYMNNDVANRKSFLPNGWYRTGDFGYMDEDGHLNVLGRHKDNFYYDGNLIIPSKIEQILNKCPLIETSAVVKVPHKNPAMGHMPAIFVKHGDTAGSHKYVHEEILQVLKESVNHLQEMTVNEIFCVKEFPYTTCGKIDKAQLQNNCVREKYN